MRDERSIIEPAVQAYRYLSLRIVVTLIVVAGAGLLLYVARSMLIPLAIGAIIAVILFPWARRLSRLSRMSHQLATAVIYLVLLAALVPLFLLVGPLLAQRIEMAQDDILNLLQRWEAAGAEEVTLLGFSFAAQEIVDEITAAATEWVTATASGAISFVIDAAHTLLLAVMALVVGFYLTRDAEAIVSHVIDIAPPRHRTSLRRLVAEIYRIWGKFFRSQLILCLIVAVILGVASAALGLPHPLLLGIWGGLLEFLPTVGHMVWGATVVILAIFNGSTYLPLSPLAFLVLVIGVYIVFTQIDLNVLIPHIIGGSLHLHPLVVLLGVIAGIEIAGVLGVVLAAPTIASLRVIGRALLSWLDVRSIGTYGASGGETTPAEEGADHE
jgi:predicted PurR-regulated permease PerM